MNPRTRCAPPRAGSSRTTASRRARANSGGISPATTARAAWRMRWITCSRATWPSAPNVPPTLERLDPRVEFLERLDQRRDQAEVVDGLVSVRARPHELRKDLL